MTDYISKFNHLAVTQRGLGGNEDIKLWFSADASRTVNIQGAAAIIRRTLKQLGLKAAHLPGKCFSTVAAASHTLLLENVKHTVTIGDVIVDGKRYFGATAASIGEDMEKGFMATEPANAHSWITLENGVVLDLTIISSFALQQRRKLPKMAKAIYVSDRSRELKFVHIPYFLGLEYFVKVTTPPSEESFLGSMLWATQMDDVLRS